MGTRRPKPGTLARSVTRGAVWPYTPPPNPVAGDSLAHSDQRYLTLPITKVERGADGSRVVYGKVTDDVLDLDEQIVDADWAAKALTDWFEEWANVRQMHSHLLAPAGRAVGLNLEDDGAYARVKVVEPNAIKLVDERVYQAFSVGIIDPVIVPDKVAPGGRIKGGIINEVSLVDYPANTRCKFALAKRAKNGTVKDVGKVMGTPADGMLTKAFRTAKGEWSTAYQNDLPDSSFAYIEAGGTKDGTGKTTPRSLRHFPIKDKDGTLDEPHVRAALSRVEGGQSPFAEKARPKIEAAARSLGIGADNKESKVADADTNKVPPGASKCKACKGSGMFGGGDDGGKCKACKGKGFTFPSKKAAAAIKSGDKADDDVQDALDDVSDAVDDAQSAQGADTDDDDGKAAKAARKAQRKARRKIPVAAKRMHDALCPCYDPKAVRGTYQLPKGALVSTIDTKTLTDELARVATKGDTGPIGEAYAALAAAEHLLVLKPDTFDRMRKAAFGSFLAANPGLPSLRPELIDPDDFKRGWISGATPEVPGSGGPRIPASAPLEVARFQDPSGDMANTMGSQSGGAGGRSVAKGPTGREFYTNAARSEHTQAMATLHDHIANAYPDICPLADRAGMPNDSDGRMGQSAAMLAPPPQPGTRIDNKQSATLTGVGDTSRANKVSGADTGGPVVTKMAKLVKRQSRELRTLRKQVKDLRSRPDQSKAAVRAHPFQRPDTDTPERSEALKRAQELKEAVQSRNSVVASAAMEELRELPLTPKQRARILVDA